MQKTATEVVIKYVVVETFLKVECVASTIWLVASIIFFRFNFLNGAYTRADSTIKMFRLIVCLVKECIYSGNIKTKFSMFFFISYPTFEAIS